MVVAVRPVAQHNAAMPHIHIEVLVDKLLVRNLQYAMRHPHAGIRKIDPSMLLIPAQRFHPQRLAIDPPESRNVVLPLLDRHVHPRHFAALCTHNPHADIRVQIARLRIPLLLHRRVRRDPVGDRILRNIASTICKNARFFESGDQK